MSQNKEHNSSPLENRDSEPRDTTTKKSRGTIATAELLWNLSKAGLTPLGATESLRQYEVGITSQVLQSDYAQFSRLAELTYLEYSDNRKTYAPEELWALKRKAFLYSLQAVMPAAMIDAIYAAEHAIEISNKQLEMAQAVLSSYLMVDESETEITITDQPVAPSLIEKLSSKGGLDTLIVAGPPGSGKTSLMDALDLLLSRRGCVVVTVGFDELIKRFFTREGKPTKAWGKKVSRELDANTVGIRKRLKVYEPLFYKQEGRKFVYLIDTLGYEIDSNRYGLEMFRLLHPELEEGSAAVLSLIAEQEVIQYTINNRPRGGVKPTNPDQNARQLQQGAPAEHVIRHHDERQKKITALRQDSVFQMLSSRVNLGEYFPHYSPEEMQDLVERLVYSLLDRNQLQANANWTSVINFYNQEEGVYFTPPSSHGSLSQAI